MILTALALLLGPILAVVGVWIFSVEATTCYRDRETLRIGRTIATLGRWASLAGIGLRVGHGGQYGTGMVLVLMAAVTLATMTIITKANLTGRPNGAPA